MLDYGPPIPVGDDQWLTIAARDDNDSRLGGGDPYDVSTIVLRIRGADLAAFRAGKLTREEALARWRPGNTDGSDRLRLGTRCALASQSRSTVVHRLPPAASSPCCAAVAAAARRSARKVVRVDDVVTGWFDAGVTEDGKNKIVPSISLTLTNTGGDAAGAVQLNCIFRRVGDPEEWSAALVRAVDQRHRRRARPRSRSSSGRRRGTPACSRARNCSQNRLFVDSKVEVFGKHGSATWVKLGEFHIDRQLLTR